LRSRRRDYEAADELALQGLQAVRDADDPYALIASLRNAGLADCFSLASRSPKSGFRDVLTLERRERSDDARREPALGLAAVAAWAGERQRAATLLGAASQIHVAAAPTADRPFWERLIERFLEPARSALSGATWATPVENGRALTLDEICGFATLSRRGDQRARAVHSRSGRPAPARRATREGLA
jgi:hypothetical protein